MNETLDRGRENSEDLAGGLIVQSGFRQSDPRDAPTAIHVVRLLLAIGPF